MRLNNARRMWLVWMSIAGALLWLLAVPHEGGTRSYRRNGSPRERNSDI